MAPLMKFLMGRNFNASTTPDEYSQQWSHPGDVFSVLLILGGDVVARAVAQVAGSHIGSVTFSFGACAKSLHFHQLVLT